MNKWSLVLTFTILLSACGGGEKTPDASPLNISPVADAGDNIEVEELTEITLQGTASQ